MGLETAEGRHVMVGLQRIWEVAKILIFGAIFQGRLIATFWKTCS